MARRSSKSPDVEPEYEPEPEPEPVEEPAGPYKARQKRAYKMTDERRAQLVPILEKGRAVRAANVAARRIEIAAEVETAVATKVAKVAKKVSKAVERETKARLSAVIDDNASEDESITAPKPKPRRKVVELDDDSADEIVVKRVPRRASTIKPKLEAPAAVPEPPRAVSAPRSRIVFY